MDMHYILLIINQVFLLLQLLRLHYNQVYLLYLMDSEQIDKNDLKNLLDFHVLNVHHHLVLNLIFFHHLVIMHDMQQHLLVNHYVVEHWHILH